MMPNPGETQDSVTVSFFATLGTDMSRPLSELARAKMLAAASELLFTEGVCGFTIEEVAHRAGVAKTTIYRHFPSRNGLLIAAFDRGIAVPETPDTGSLRDDLVQFLTSVLPIFSDSRLRLASLDILAASSRDPELHEIYQSMLNARSGPLRTIFDRGKIRGEISPDVGFDVAFDFIEGPLILRSLLQPEALDDIDIEALVDRVLILLKG